MVEDLSRKNTQPFDRLQTAVKVDPSAARAPREHGKDVVDRAATGDVEPGLPGTVAAIGKETGQS
ncbi:MAG: hypothetical protein EBZ59_06675 [Planctomycetia bacterium]|nr:hypothetical protein [Planctomycetia bacterium]